jgi:hypothetical protein
MKPVENANVRFRALGRRKKQIQPGSRRSVGSENPFRPTTLKMVEEWIRHQPVSEQVKAELIKMVRQIPNGALDHFRSNIQTHIGTASERVRQLEG